MHVRVASGPGGGGHLTRRARRPLRRPAFALLIVCCVSAAACSGQADLADGVEWRMTPTPPVVGTPTTLEVTLRDRSRRPVQGARIQVEAHMSHPGMAPIVAPAEERGDGVYDARLQLTMRGEWILMITGTLPDGRRLSHRIEIPDVGPPE
jgi:hypothetical protein